MPKKKTAAKAKPAAKKKARDKKVRSKKPSPKGRAAMSKKPSTIDEYLAQVESETRQLLEALRRTIRKHVPEAEECISYSLPAFRYRGKVIGGFAATSTGGSYYPFSGTTLTTLAAELSRYSQTKSAVHFTKDAPLPISLVKKLLDARKAEL